MIDWTALLHFTVSPLEMVLRGSAVYWFLFCLFRFVLRRDAGSVAIADIMLLVLIADAAQNGMAGGYQSLADGAVLVGSSPPGITRSTPPAIASRRYGDGWNRRR